MNIASVNTNFGKRSLTYKASSIWNCLPPELKPSVTQFKNKLKL